jgi:glucose/arabinose dehydrogenase
LREISTTQTTLYLDAFILIAAFSFTIVLIAAFNFPFVYAEEFLITGIWGGFGQSQDQLLNTPEGITVDSQGNVYVADTANNRIKKFSGNGTFISKVGGFGPVNGTFWFPEGIAVDSDGYMYVADTANNRIQKFSANGTFTTKWGKEGLGESHFSGLSGIAVDSLGNVYVADTANNRIQKFSANGTFTTNWGTYGSDDGAFNAPEGIAVDSLGNVYVADTANNRIQKFSANGTFTTNWGTYGFGEGELKYPAAIAVTSQGNVYVADTGNDRVVLLRSSENGTAPQPGNGNSAIQIEDPSLRADVVAEDLFYPTKIAFSSENEMLILALKDFGGAVRYMVDGEVSPEPAVRIDLGGDPQGCTCGLDVAKNANGTTNVFVYHYVKIGTADEVGIHVTKYELVDGKLINPVRIFHIPEIGLGIHNGGGLVVGPDQNVYFIIGELDTHRTLAQNVVDGPEPDGSSGIIRITQDGRPAPDNPLGNATSLSAYYYAYGIRNGFGIAFDPLTGKLWDTENGPAYGDELNIAEPGFNGGWSRLQGIWEPRPPSFNYPGNVLLEPTDLEDFDGLGKYSAPEFIWYNPTAPTGITFLTSEKLGEQYENDLFVADYNNGYIYRFELNEQRDGLLLDGALSDKIANDISERELTVFARGFGQITDLRVGPDGYLYVVSLGQGKIYKIVPDTEVGPVNGDGSNSDLVTSFGTALIGGNEVQLRIDSSSKVSDFSFDEEDKRFSLKVSHEDSSVGTVVIHVGSILTGPYTVTLDGILLTSVETTTDETTGKDVLKFDYRTGSHDVMVTGTQVVPEFSIYLVGVLLASLAAVMLLGRVANRKWSRFGAGLS